MSTIRSTTTAALLSGAALLFAGVAACGTEDGTATTVGGRPQLSSVDLVEGAQAGQARYLDELRTRAAHPGP